MTTTETVNPIKRVGRGSATPTAVPPATADGIPLHKTPWECDHCHQTFPLNTKGKHLRSCKLNPDRARLRRRGSARTDLVPCDLCRKPMAPDSLDYHLRHHCRVVQAIQEGRVVTAEQADRTALAVVTEVLPRAFDKALEEELTTSPREAPEAEAFVTPEPPADPAPYLIDHDLAEAVLTDAVEQILDGRPVAYRQAIDINRLIRDLVLVLAGEG